MQDFTYECVNPMYVTSIIGNTVTYADIILIGDKVELVMARGCAYMEFCWFGGQLVFHPDNLEFVLSNFKITENKVPSRVIDNIFVELNS